MAAPAPRPAHLLVGVTLGSGWKVVEMLPRGPDATGGHFSVGYRVEKQGHRAFLKAFDYREAFDAADPAPIFQRLTSEYEFERALLERCAKLRRVIKAIEFGAHRLDPANFLMTVQFAIFELADGDIRQYLALDAKTSLVWKLRTLHQTAAALVQLHGAAIAHQDVKPSNVLVFGVGDAKLADLGRASAKGQLSPHDHHVIAGAHSYAPPELRYRNPSADWDERRLGCDIYLLGSLVFFFFTGLSAAAILDKHLDEARRPSHWLGFFYDVLPYLVDAFEDALTELRSAIPPKYRDELAEIARQLCYPDPAQRGHPKNVDGIGARYAVDRYMAQFDVLAHKAEVDLRLGR